MNNEVEAALEDLMLRQAELKWIQLRTSKLPTALQEELERSEALIAAQAWPGILPDSSAARVGW